MKNLRRLGATVCLTFVLGVAAFAGDILTPPFAAQMPLDDSAVPGEVETPPASDAIELPSVAELAMNLLLLF